MCFITLEQHFCIYASIFSASDDNLNCQFTFCISSLCAACSLFIFPPYREAVRLCVCLVIIRGVNWTSRNLSRAFSLLKVPTSAYTLWYLVGSSLTKPPVSFKHCEISRNPVDSSSNYAQMDDRQWAAQGPRVWRCRVHIPILVPTRSEP